MINNQKKFIDILNNVNIISKDSNINNENIDKAIETVKNVSLIVPVVGDFSSGKSTLLNKFIGKDILSVNVNPETAVPCELYYSKEEYAIGIDEKGNEIRLKEVTKENTKDFLYIKRYVDSENLKKIEPIILVDMPGFDSPLENHNRAIMSYLDKGIYYILLTPVDDGTVSKSMINQINNIKNLKKDLSVFLTKTDLRDDDTVKKVKKEVQDRLSDIGIYETVNTISEKDINLFDKMIKELNTEELFYSIFEDFIKVVCKETESLLQIKISALKSDVNKNKAIIEELEKTIKNIENRRDSLIEEYKSNPYHKKIDEVINEIAKRLDSNVDNLVAIIRVSKEAFNDEIMNIIQSVLIEKIDTIVNDINLDINVEYSKEVSKLDTAFSTYDIDKISDDIRGVISHYEQLRIKDVEYYRTKTDMLSIKNRANGTVYLTAGAGILTLATAWNPAIEIAIILAPIVITLVVDFLNQKKEEEELRNKIISTFPKVKREIREKLVIFLSTKINEAIDNIYNQYNGNLSEKMKELEKVVNDMNEKGNVNIIIDNLENNLKKLKNISSNL
ncbi:dynamin family protein [Brachyspira pulli]|uniref:dynamin family protein n=1 Tax=Brachyspira pulli TaxID=310721 RepID=UPI0030042FF1